MQACSLAAPAETAAIIEKERADEGSSAGGSVTYGRACFGLPHNRAASALFHSRLLRKRVLPGRLPWTLWQLLVCAGLLTLLGGLCYLEHTRAKWAYKNPHRVLLELTTISAYVFEYTLAMLFLPLNHNPNGLFPWLLGSSWEYLLALHKALGDAAVLLVTLHSVTVTIWFWTLSHDVHKVIHTLLMYKNVTGVISLFCFWLLRLFSFDWLRRRVPYELFYAAHVVLTASGVTLMTLHVRKPLFLWEVLAVPAGLWAIDLLWRAWTSFRSGRARVVAKTTMHKSGCTVLELEAIHGPAFAFEPGQWGLLCLPAISRVQFHPFALLASTLEDDDSNAESGKQRRSKKIRILAKTLGGWTKRLESTPLAALRRSSAFLQGPIGRIPIDMESFDNVVLVGAGCAIAPAIGHAQRLFLARRKQQHTSSNASHVQQASAMVASSSASAAAEKELIAGPKPRRVWLVLTAVYRDMLSPFSEDLAAFAGCDAFRVLCFESGPYGALFSPETHAVSAEEDSMVPVPVSLGMPDIPTLFADIRRECGAAPVAAVVCGPPPVERASVLASKRSNFTLHVEANSW